MIPPQHSRHCMCASGLVPRLPSSRRHVFLHCLEAKWGKENKNVRAKTSKITTTTVYLGGNRESLSPSPSSSPLFLSFPSCLSLSRFSLSIPLSTYSSQWQNKTKYTANNLHQRAAFLVSKECDGRTTTHNNTTRLRQKKTRLRKQRARPAALQSITLLTCSALF